MRQCLEPVGSTCNRSLAIGGAIGSVARADHLLSHRVHSPAAAQPAGARYPRLNRPPELVYRARSPERDPLASRSGGDSGPLAALPQAA